jgi:hypothetical protein
MSFDTDFQPETLLNKLFSLNYPARVVEDSYSNLVLRLGLLLFVFMLFRQLAIGMQLSALYLLVALASSLAVSALMMGLLSRLKELSGLGRVFALFGLLALLALVLVLI